MYFKELRVVRFKMRATISTLMLVNLSKLTLCINEKKLKSCPNSDWNAHAINFVGSGFVHNFKNTWIYFFLIIKWRHDSLLRIFTRNIWYFFYNLFLPFNYFMFDLEGLGEIGSSCNIYLILKQFPWSLSHRKRQNEVFSFR